VEPRNPDALFWVEGAFVCDRQIVFRTEPALEPFQPFPKHAREHLFLSRIERVPQAVIEFSFLNEEIDESLCIALCLQQGPSKIDQPVGDLQTLVIVFEGLVVGLSLPADRVRECNQCRLAQALRQGFVRQRPRYPVIAVFERMDGDEAQVGDACARQRGHRAAVHLVRCC
jgi:hypothetical protein